MSDKSFTIRCFFTWLLVGLVLGSPPRAVAQYVFVSSASRGQILRYNIATGAFVDAFVPLGSGGLMASSGLALGPDGNLYVSSFPDSSIKRYNGATGAYMGDFVASGSGGLTWGGDIAFGPDGNLYVSENVGGGRVVRYNGATGAFIDAFVPSGGGGMFYGPDGMTFGPDGNLYVIKGDPSDSRVQRYDGVTGAFLGDFAAPDGHGIVFGPDGNIYLSDQGNGGVLRYNAAGLFMDQFATIAHPVGLAFGPDGKFYAVDDSRGGFPGAIRRFNGSTGAYLDTLDPSNLGGLDDPIYMAFSPTVPNVPEPAFIQLGALLLGGGLLLLRRRKA